VTSLARPVKKVFAEENNLELDRLMSQVMIILNSINNLELDRLMSQVMIISNHKPFFVKPPRILKHLTLTPSNLTYENRRDRDYKEIYSP